MKRTQFVKISGYRSASFKKFGDGANITTDVFLKICEYLNCEIDEIAESLQDEEEG